MTASDDEDQIDVVQDPEANRILQLDDSQREALTKLQRTKVRILKEFEKNEVDLEKLIIVMRTKVSNLLLMGEKVLHINAPTFFKEIPNAIMSRIAIAGKGALMTTNVQKDSLAV